MELIKHRLILMLGIFSVRSFIDDSSSLDEVTNNPKTYFMNFSIFVTMVLPPGLLRIQIG